MKNIYIKIFIYISIIFLIITLIKEDFLKKPIIYEPVKIYISLILLFLGFIMDGVAWQKTLRKAKYETSVKHGIISFGLSVFGKYIPGKLWVILGRSEYISKKYELPRKDVALISINAQFISLWTGLLLGTLGVIFINKFGIYALSIIALMTLLSLIIFTEFFHKIIIRIFKKGFKFDLSIPRISFDDVIKVLPWFLLNWGMWSISFFLLSESLIKTPVSFFAAFAFPLAGALGVLVVFAPGGIGVREGLLTGYLSLIGMDIEHAAVIAITSRIWFLAGELFIFITSLALEFFNVRYYKKNKQQF